MSLLKALNVFNVRLASNSEARSFEPTHAKLHSIERHDRDSVLPQVISEPGDTKHALRNVCLELRVAGEDDNRLDGAGR